MNIIKEDNTQVPDLPRIPILGPVVSGLLSLFLVSSIVFFGPFGLFVAPLGIIPVARHEGGGRNSLLVWLPVLILLLVLSVAGTGSFAVPLLISYLFIVVIPVTSVALWKRSRASEGRWAAWTMLGVMVLMLLGIGVYCAPENPQEALLNWAHANSPQMEDFYSSLGLGRAEAQLMLDRAELALSWALPAGIAFYLLAILFWLRPRLPMLGLELAIEDFESYQSEEWLPLVFAGAGLATVFLSASARFYAVNILLMVLGLYFIHGLAIIRAHLSRWFGRGWYLRWGVAIVALQGPLPILVASLGLLDAFYPLRHRGDDDGGQE